MKKVVSGVTTINTCKNMRRASADYRCPRKTGRKKENGSLEIKELPPV